LEGVNKPKGLKATPETLVKPQSFSGKKLESLLKPGAGDRTAVQDFENFDSIAWIDDGLRQSNNNIIK
jgi:hypothetical protein